MRTRRSTEPTSRSRRAALTGLLLALPACIASCAALADATSLGDGAYTAAQAAHGEKVFERTCAACHAAAPGAVAGHGPVPPITGEDFFFRWEGASVADLFDTIRQTMPEAAPNSLSAEEYAAVTAYLLKLNGFPEGTSALDPAQRERLFELIIEALPPGS